MLSQKRRKKRQAHGLRTVELQRGKQGYGFTISGQQPCVLGNIISGSPADDQGLRDGDHLVTVNGLAVSQLSHEQVVRVIGSSSGTLKIQIAEVSRAQVLHNDSDSSDEQYVKPRYTHRSRSRSNSKTTHLSQHLPSSSELHISKKTAGLSQLTPPISKAATLSLLPREDDFPTIYNPMRPINGRASDFGVIRQHQQQEHRVGDYYRQGFNSRGQVVPGYGASGQGPLVRSNSVPDVSALDSQANGLSKILYPAMQPMAISSSSTINADDDQPSLRVIVGYIGSIEMPQDSNLPNSRLQSIRSAVRRLRVEQKVHTLVLLEIRSDGIKLINPMGSTIVHYPVNRLAMSGMYPDDKRFFGLVTIQESDEGDQAEPSSSSCHVFMVDPEFATHNVHSAKAKMFGIHCTIDPNTHRCIEFPKSCSPVLRTAAKLYKDKHGGIFDVPRRHERPVTSDSDTNSDSGLGFHKDQDETVPTTDRVYVVDIHIPDNSDLSPTPSGERVVSPAGASGLQRSQTPVKSSPLNSSRESTASINKRAQRRPQQDLSLSAFARRPSQQVVLAENGPLSAPVKPPPSVSASVFGVRATTAISPAAVTQSPLDPHTVEQLRSNMQRLLAKRKENIKDTQSLSDTESVMSDVRSRGSSGSRVSFNPHVAIATHNYQPPPPISARSSGSDSSSYIRRRDLPPHHSHHNEQSVRTRRQRSTKANSLDQTPKGRQPPPPVPPKPGQVMQRTLDELHQEKLYVQQQQHALYKRQQRQHARHEPAAWDKSQTLDERLNRPPQYSTMSSRNSDSLDSKLSPRAYPSTAPRPARVATGERSAFQKVSPESAHQMHFYNSNNNNNEQESHAPRETARSVTRARRPDGEQTADSYTRIRATGRTLEKPVPAPRPSRSLAPDKVSMQLRSCSVPPNTRSLWQVGRELNVDDGLSIRSESTQSMENQHRQNDRHLDVDQGTVLNDRAVSSESLVEVGTRNLNRNNEIAKPPVNNNNNVSRVASWAVSFENLLQDEDGILAFTDYLIKEFSYENIEFWLACENFKKLTDARERQVEAVRLYNSHIANNVVNIDSNAAKKAEEQLSNPSSSMFEEAQSQVFRLMKTDSYGRFIKSAIYQSCVVKEFEHDKLADKEKTRMVAMSESSDSDTQKRRTFPNFLKDISRTLTGRGQYDSKGWSRSSDDGSLERSTKPALLLGKTKRYEGAASLTADLTAIKHRIDSGGSQDEGDDDRLLRVVLPDGSTSVIRAKQSDCLKNMLARLLSKKNDQPINLIEVFPLDSQQSLDMSLKLEEIPYHELRLEKRIIVRLELPNKKVTPFKAKSHRPLRALVVWMLNRNNYNIDDVVVTENGYEVDLDQPVHTMENKHKLVVMTKENFHAGAKYKKGMLVGKKEKGVLNRKLHHNSAHDVSANDEELVDLEAADIQQMLSQDTLSKRSKAAQLFGMKRNSASLDDGGKGTLKKTKGKNVTFGPTKSMDERYLAKPPANDKFLDMLTKIQSCRLDDQRGLSIDVGDLPEFLKSGGSETDEGSMSPPQHRINRDGAPGSNLAVSSAYYNDGSSTASSEAAIDNTDLRLSNHHERSDDSFNTPSKLNTSYHNAIAGSNGHFNFDNRTPDINSTLLPGNRTLDDTLTPAKFPLSPLPTNLPPPPQFGNEALTSTPHSAAAPPPYREAISRSSLATSFNSNNSNNINNSTAHGRGLHSVTTIPGNNPGNRLSYAHHQPLIFDDGERLGGASERSTPSPTTHTLVLTADDRLSEPSKVNDSYNFYERQYVSSTSSRPTEPVKVTFV